MLPLPAAVPVDVAEVRRRRRAERMGRSLRAWSVLAAVFAGLAASDLGPTDRVGALGGTLVALSGVVAGTLLVRRARGGDDLPARVVRGLRRSQLVPQAEHEAAVAPELDLELDDDLLDALYAEGTPGSGTLRDGLRADLLDPVELGDFLVASREEEGRPEGTRHLTDPDAVDLTGLDGDGLDALLRELDDASLRAHALALLDRWGRDGLAPDVAVPPDPAPAALRQPDEAERAVARSLSSRLVPLRLAGLLLALGLLLLGTGGVLAVQLVQDRGLAGRAGAHEVALGDPGLLVDVAFDDRDYSDVVLTDTTGSYTARGVDEDELEPGQRFTLVPEAPRALSGVALTGNRGPLGAPETLGLGVLAVLLGALLSRAGSAAAVRPVPEPARWHLAPDLEHLVLQERVASTHVPGVLAERPRRRLPTAAAVPAAAVVGALVLAVALLPGATGPEDPAVALPAVVAAGYAPDVRVAVRESDELARSVDENTFGTPGAREATAYLRRPDLPLEASDAELRAQDLLPRCTVRLTLFAEPVDPAAALRSAAEQERQSEQGYTADPTLRVTPSRAVALSGGWTGRTDARVQTRDGAFGGETEALLVTPEHVALLDCRGPLPRGTTTDADSEPVSDAAVATAERGLQELARALPAGEVDRLADLLLRAPATEED